MSGITWELIDRYLAHQCAEVERDLVERWLEEESSRLIIAELLSEAAAARTQYSSKASLSRRAELLTAMPRQPPRVVQLKPVRLVAFAATISVVVLLGWRLYAGSYTASPAGPVRIATTPPGQRAILYLADGTRVMLGVASTLRSPAEFGTGRREVDLTGEAYFEVSADERRPFVVRAGDVVARDMGTSFLVRAYPDEPHARIVVREGRVAMGGVGNPDTARLSQIAPGQLGRLLDDGSPVVEPADTAAYFSWTEGRLTIDNKPLREALPQLSRWFDLDFRLGDSALANIPLTATLGSRLSPDMLDLLARSLGARQERTGRTVTLYLATGIH